MFVLCLVSINKTNYKTNLMIDELMCVLKA
jgi:hypothetical protein